MILQSRPEVELAGLRVLLVEDDPDDHFLMRELLAEVAGGEFTLHWAPDAERGLSVVDGAEHDIFLVDYRLAGRSGLDFLRTVRERGIDTPVIILTGQGDRQTDVEAMLAGAADYLEKGAIDAPTMERAIRYALERRRAQKALQESEERYRRLVEHCPDAITVSQAGAIVYANPAAAQLLGAPSPDALVGRPLVDFAHPEFIDTVRERLRQIADQGRAAAMMEQKMVRVDGTVVHVEVTSIPTTYGGEPAVQSIARDVTERHQLEEQLRQAQRMEAVGKLAGGIAHEFNNLLAVITGFAQLLQLELEEPDERRSYVSHIQHAAERSSVLTRQMLAFGRKQILQPRDLDPNGVAMMMEPLLRQLLPASVRLELVLAPEIGQIKADPGQLEQVLINLVTNARDAVGDAGQIRIESYRAELPARSAAGGPALPAGDYVVLAVHDTGSGIDSFVLPHIFEPFYTTKEVGKGTGLGLSTVHGIVRQSGGDIVVDTAPGEGTSILVYLPRLAATTHDAEHPPVRPLADSPRQGRQAVLVVEDVRSLRMFTRRALELWGFEVLEAENGLEALQVLDSHAGPIDLVVTDIVMPGMDGRRLVERLRERWPEVPVLFVSGYTEDQIVRQGVLQEGEHFLSKPYQLADFSARVRALLAGAPST